MAGQRIRIRLKAYDHRVVDHSATDIVDMYHLAWRRWQWRMMTRRPATVAHHFQNALRREGLGGLVRITKYSAERFLKVVGSH